MNYFEIRISVGMTSKSYTRWTDSMKMKLANITLKQNGYKRTGENMEKKWKTIAELLMADAEFSNSAVVIDWKSLQTQFKRFQEAVTKEAGVDKPGANFRLARGTVSISIVDD